MTSERRPIDNDLFDLAERFWLNGNADDKLIAAMIFAAHAAVLCGNTEVLAQLGVVLCQSNLAAITLQRD